MCCVLAKDMPQIFKAVLQVQNPCSSKQRRFPSTLYLPLLIFVSLQMQQRITFSSPRKTGTIGKGRENLIAPDY